MVPCHHTCHHVSVSVYTLSRTLRSGSDVCVCGGGGGSLLLQDQTLTARSPFRLTLPGTTFVHTSDTVDQSHSSKLQWNLSLYFCQLWPSHRIWRLHLPLFHFNVLLLTSSLTWLVIILGKGVAGGPGERQTDRQTDTEAERHRETWHTDRQRETDRQTETRLCVLLCARACVCVCVRACVRACVRVRVCVYVTRACVHAGDVRDRVSYVTHY